MNGTPGERAGSAFGVARRRQRHDCLCFYSHAVQLQQPTITVDYATADDIATGSGNPKDYNRITNSTLTFTPGQTSQMITVDVIGETDSENDETFFVNLTNPTNAIVLD